MRGKCLGSVFVLLLTILAGSGPCNAQTTYDIADYMPWKAGQWTILQEYDPLDTSCGGCYLNKEELAGLAVSRSGPYTILAEYHDGGQPGNWVASAKLKYQLTTDFVKLLAFTMDSKWWTLKPAANIPRSLRLNQMFQYNGGAVNGTDRLPLGLVLSITKAGFSVSTPAGPFANCIEMQWIISVGSGHGSIETKVMAKGVGEVKLWHASLSRDRNGYTPQAYGADTEYKEIIQKGDSNPPFP